MTDKRIPGSGQKKKNKTSVVSDGQLKNVVHCRQRKTESWPEPKGRLKCIENVVKFGQLVIT